MPAANTRPRMQSTPRPPTARTIAIPLLTLAIAVAWYVAIRAAHAELVRTKEGKAIELARGIMSQRRAGEKKRLAKECGVISYDPRLGMMLKQGPEPELVGELTRTIGGLMPGIGVAVLSNQGTPIASTIQGLDEAAIHSSNLVERIAALEPAPSGTITNRALSGVWILRNEPRRVMDVCADSIRLGEPMGVVALASPIDAPLPEIRSLTKVAGAVFVGSELFYADIDLRETFASLRDVVPGPPTRIRRGDRELIVAMEEIESSGLGIRMAWIDEHPVEKDSALFELLLWVPIAGALIVGARSSRRRA
jgi:hypothetical protein